MERPAGGRPPRSTFRLALGGRIGVASLLLATGCDPAGGGTRAPAIPSGTAETIFRIGSLDDPETSLTNVGRILGSAEDDVFYVTQPQETEVRVHGADGELLGRFGGRGDGPGEFQNLAAIGWWGDGRDTLWTGDFQLGRVSLFRPDGTFVRSIPLALEPFREHFVMRSFSAILPDGTGLGMPSYASHLLAQGEIHSIPFLRVPVEGGEPRVVAEVPAGNQQLAVSLGNGMGFTSQRWPDRPIFLASGRSGRVAIVERYAATSPEDAEVRVTTLDAEGDTLWARVIAYDPVPLGRDEVAEAIDALVETWTGFTDANPRDLEAQFRDGLFAPAFRPPIEGGLVGPDGSTWLRWAVPPEAGTNRWWRLSADGEPAAEFELPENVSLRSVDRDAGWAVETDDLDVPYVVRLRFEEGGPD